MSSCGLVSKVMRTMILEYVPRWVGQSFSDLFLGFLQAWSMSLGVSDGEVNSFASKEVLSLSGEVMLVEDEVDLSVGFGEREECLDSVPMMIIAPNGSTTLAELEVTEVLSLEAKMDNSGWVKHRIPGFSKLVELSMTRHEKQCIVLLQRLEIEMEVANLLRRKATSNRIVTKSKNKGRRELKT